MTIAEKTSRGKVTGGEITFPAVASHAQNELVDMPGDLCERVDGLIR